MNRYIKALGSLLFAGALAACGGGGGSSGSTDGPGGPGPGPVDPTNLVADFAVFTDKTTIANNGADSAQLTVVTVNANRNVVAGATVTVSTDQNSVFVPSGAVTDSSGTLTGLIQTGGDKTDRDITVTVSANGITKRVVVRVSGSRLTLTASPANPTPGQEVQLTATLLDSGGSPIANQTVITSGTFAAVQNRRLTTDSSGQATLSFRAPSAADVYVIGATGSGTQASNVQLNVLASGNSVPDARIPDRVVPSLSASPNVLSVNSANSDINKSALRFLLLDRNDRPIKNVRVRFIDLTTGLPAIGASIASGDTTLYTDGSGQVTTQYVAGQNSSRTNGVTVRACYKSTDFVSADFDRRGNCEGRLEFVDVSMTVAGQALSVSIGDDNVLEKGQGTYIKRFAVTVADSAGRAVANAPVDISVDLTHYSKGFFGRSSLPLSTVPLDPNAAYPVRMDQDPTRLENVWCPNEDANRNGNVDPGENYNRSTDTNGQPTLEPRKSDLLISYDNPAETRTNASGVLVIRVEYSQRFATWLAYRVRVTANVSGSQGLSERLFITNFLEADEDTGSFRSAPYGTRSCLTEN